ncbi:MAG: NAD(P)H-binding protein [Polaromonas sp.]
MNIALIGGTGYVGAPVLVELLRRGHRVTALTRQPITVTPRDGLTVVAADALDAGQVARAVAGHEAVISAFNPGWSEPRLYELFLQGSQSIVDGVKAAGVKRLLIVGCAGSLYVAPGVQLIDTPLFPILYKQGGLAARELLNRILRETMLDWSFILPPVELTPGPRTGRYRLGTDKLLFGESGQTAELSVPDLAVAVVDEIEQSRHVQRRFTVAN